VERKGREGKGGEGSIHNFAATVLPAIGHHDTTI